MQLASAYTYNLMEPHCEANIFIKHDLCFFQFHSVGGGLYTGTVLFRLFHLNSKRPNLEVLTTLLVILTIVQVNERTFGSFTALKKVSG